MFSFIQCSINYRTSQAYTAFLRGNIDNLVSSLLVGIHMFLNQASEQIVNTFANYLSW